MLLFIDGQVIILSVEQNIELYFAAYVEEFGDISRTQWEGSQEYEIAYANAQRDHQNAVVMQQALQKTFDAITEINQEIKRPAVLHSRVAERFAEAGYIATIRVADINTRGIVAICVDYPATPVNRVLTVGNDGGVTYGYNLGAPYGGLDNQIFDGLNINQVNTTSDYSAPNIIYIAGGVPFPNYPTDLSVNISGYGAVVFTWDGTNLRYELADNALADFIVAADGTGITFNIENEVTTDPAQDTEIANLIVNEMLPAGQHMIGNVSEAVVISNGQSVLAQWATPSAHDVDFKITLTRATNSPYPVDTVDDIQTKFLANFAEQNALGQDLTPETYYQIAIDAPWASKIETVYSLDGAPDTGDVYPANYDDKFNATLDLANIVII